MQSIASPPYEKVNHVMDALLFNPIAQNIPIFRCQMIARDLGDGMLPCGIQSRAGRHGSVVEFPEGTLEGMPNALKTQMKPWY